MQDLYTILPLAALALIFWFLVVRPASRQRKQVMELQARLKAGDRVMLSSGIYGEVVELDDVRARVRVAEGVVLEVARGAISAVDADSLATEAAQTPVAEKGDADQ